MAGFSYRPRFPLFAEEARKRQATSGPGAYGAKPLTTSRGEAVKGESIEHAAKSVGVGATTVFKVARIKREHPERIKEIEDGHKTANAVHIELFEPDKQKAPASPATEVHRKAIASSLFENVRGSKEHRVTALQAIEKLLRDTEPVFRFGFWSVVNAHIDTVDSEKAAELQKRTAKCRQEFSRLIRSNSGARCARYTDFSV